MGQQLGVQVGAFLGERGADVVWAGWSTACGTCWLWPGALGAEAAVTASAPVGPQAWARKARSRRELPTTKTEEKAIAAPAIIGLSRPAAASGRAATL